ncbi:MAG: glycosyl hydrolase 53 family protein [Bacteroidota bacterium]
MEKSDLFFLKNIPLFIVLFFCFHFPREAKAQFANGADIGWLSQMESSGYLFYNDSGVKENCMAILKEQGINALRFRVWVNPVGGWCGKKDVATMAHRADSMGFRVMIDFHYSDTWADPGKQTKPAAWASHTISQLLTDIYNHTYDVLDTLKSIGVIPTWVQVGNETNTGMLWPEGNTTTNMKNFADMVNSGYDAIKAVDSSILVVVHLSDGYNNNMYRRMFDGLKNNGARWDVIGMSQYPYWANLPWETDNNECYSNMLDMISRYNKKVMICETGMQYDQAVTCKTFLLDLIAKTKSVGGLGVFYWEPECYNWQGYKLGAWDPVTRKPTVAMDAFLESSDSSSTSVKEDPPRNQGYNNESDGVSVFPNPVGAGQNFMITLKDKTVPTSIRIFTVNGQKLFETTTVNNDNIFIRNLRMSPGIYFVQLTNRHQKITKTLIVK